MENLKKNLTTDKKKKTKELINSIFVNTLLIYFCTLVIVIYICILFHTYFNI